MPIGFKVRYVLAEIHNIFVELDLFRKTHNYNASWGLIFLLRIINTSRFLGESTIGVFINRFRNLMHCSGFGHLFYIVLNPYLQTYLVIILNHRVILS